MFTVMRARAWHKLVVVAAIFERGFHLQICQPPIAPVVVEIRLAILQEDANGPDRMLANLGRVIVPAANIGK